MKVPALIAAGVALLLALLGSVFVVNEGHSAIVFRLGTVVREDVGPGLRFKWPLIETARTFDRRLKVLPAEPERYLTADKLDVSVDFFALGRIEDMRRFFQATGGNEDVAAERLAPIIRDSLRNEINSLKLLDVVKGDREAVVGKQLEAINRGASTLGVKILDIRIKRIDLPQDSNVLQSVYNQMRSQRLQVASQLRAEGFEQSQAVRATADRDKTVILAEAARLYGEAAAKDPSFFAFQRSLDSYRKAFADGQSVIVLDRDDPYLQYLKSDR